jgi:hypothetical protein
LDLSFIYAKHRGHSRETAKPAPHLQTFPIASTYHDGSDDRHRRTPSLALPFCTHDHFINLIADLGRPVFFSVCDQQQRVPVANFIWMQIAFPRRRAPLSTQTQRDNTISIASS